MKLFGGRPAALWRLLLAVSIVTSVHARTIFEAIQSVPELSSLYERLNASPALTQLLSSADNFTFLAPTNAALSSSPNASQDLFEATIRYSLLHGGFPALSFTNAPKFANSNLGNTTYTNNTSGQAVQLVLGNGGGAQIISGNQTISKLVEQDILCTGGIVHSIDTILSIPVPVVQEVTSQKLEYFVSILNTGGFLSSENAVFVTAVQAITDATYFIPNSQKALDDFAVWQKRGKLFSDTQNLFEYHVVQGFVGFSDRLKDGLSLKTAAGENVTIHVQGGQTYVNAVKILESDFIVANGVVHVLDDLLDPLNTAGPAKPTSSSPSSTATSSPTTSATSSPNASSSPTPAAAPLSSSSSSSSSSNKLKLGLGLGLGLGLAALLLLAVIFYILRQRKARREREAALAASGGWEGQSETTATATPNEKGVFGGGSAAAAAGAGSGAGIFARRTGANHGSGIGSGGHSRGAGSGGFDDEIQGQPMRLEGLGGAYDGSKGGPRTYSVNAQGPSIPPRSPSRLNKGHEFF